LHPRFFPVAADDAARLITAVEEQDGTDAAMALTGATLRAVWAQERDIADAQTLAQLLAECGLPGARLEESRSALVEARYQAHTDEAIAAGVFGAPSYRVDGELFWGQDRLDFVQRCLQT
jgi:2-hydroxychromene-2-carboxylate isomerase